MNSNLPPQPPRRPKQTFASRNVVALTMIPAIVAFHVGWYLLQQNQKLVTAEEKIDLPVVTFAKYCYKSITDGLAGAGGGGSAEGENKIGTPIAAAK